MDKYDRFGGKQAAFYCLDCRSPSYANALFDFGFRQIAEPVC